MPGKQAWPCGHFRGLAPRYGYQQQPGAGAWLAPRVAIMDNGSKKGAYRRALDVVKSSPGLQVSGNCISRMRAERSTMFPIRSSRMWKKPIPGSILKVTAHQDGSFEVFNPRNKFYEAVSRASEQSAEEVAHFVENALLVRSVFDGKHRRPTARIICADRA